MVIHTLLGQAVVRELSAARARDIGTPAAHLVVIQDVVVDEHGHVQHFHGRRHGNHRGLVAAVQASKSGNDQRGPQALTASELLAQGVPQVAVVRPGGRQFSHACGDVLIERRTHMNQLRLNARSQVLHRHGACHCVSVSTENQTP